MRVELAFVVFLVTGCAVRAWSSHTAIPSSVTRPAEVRDLADGEVQELTLDGVCPGMTYAQVLQRRGLPPLWRLKANDIVFHYLGRAKVWFSGDRVVAVTGVELQQNGRSLARSGEDPARLLQAFGRPRQVCNDFLPQFWWPEHQFGFWRNAISRERNSGLLGTMLLAAPEWEKQRGRADFWTRNIEECATIDGIQLGEHRNALASTLERARQAGNNPKLTFSRSGFVVAVEGSTLCHPERLAHHFWHHTPLVVGQTCQNL